METLTARYEAALRRAAEWQAAESLEELEEGASIALLQLIPADGAGWNEIGLRNPSIRLVTSPQDYFPDRRDLLAELIHENPIFEHAQRGRGSACAFSDLIGVREYHRRQIYADVYRPYRVEDQLGAMVQVDGETMLAVALNRSRRSFTRDDRTLLDLLRGHLVAAYRSLRDREEARVRRAARERALDLTGRGVALLDRHGAVVDASPLYARWFGAGERAEPGVYRREDAELVVRRVAGDPPLLLLDERRLAPDPERVRMLGLSRREAEVVALAGRGLTSRAVAGELFLSTRTVEKHLENAFRKLGVRSRADAARALFD